MEKKWKFLDISHREHIIFNPISLEKIHQLCDLLRLPPHSRVLDIGAGTGEFLIQLAERYRISGIGVDISSLAVAAAERKRQERAPDADLVFIEMDGNQYLTDFKEPCDVVICLGASNIFQGYQGTLEALKKVVLPKGWIIIGTAYLAHELPQEGQQAIDKGRIGTIKTHFENVAAAAAIGLHLVYSVVGNQDDWDRYEGLQWYATDQYALTHPDDPDLPDLLRAIQQSKESYLKWRRDTLGWAVYAFRKPGD
jgi:SAM-dependent methyltransferase